MKITIESDRPIKSINIVFDHEEPQVEFTPSSIPESVTTSLLAPAKQVHEEVASLPESGLSKIAKVVKPDTSAEFVVPKTEREPSVDDGFAALKM